MCPVGLPGSAPRAQRVDVARGRQLASILAGCHAGRLPECARKVGLARESEGQRDFDQGRFAFDQQDFRALEAPCNDITMRRLPDGLPEGSREVEPAEAGDRSHAVEGEVAFQMAIDVVEDAEQPA